MIIVRFHGGLGNQMFEYTFYKYLEKMYAGYLKADLTWFDRNYSEHQGYELKKVFNIDLPCATYEEVAKVHEYYPRYYSFAGFRFLARKIAKSRNKKNNPTGEHIYDFGPSQYVKNEIFDSLDVTKDYYIEGVYCSDNYLKCIDTKPQELFQFAKTDEENESLIAKMKTENSVAIHVRRGDYVGNVFDIVSLSYYEKAVEYIREHVENPVFYVFSDDMNYIKEKFVFLKEYVPVHNEGKASFTDMKLISACRHMIIANSSFSYWGAVIGEKDDSIIIAPEKYKADEELSLSRDNWIKMPV